MDNTNMFPNNDNRQSNVNNENNIVQQQFTEYKPVEQQQIYSIVLQMKLFIILHRMM